MANTGITRIDDLIARTPGVAPVAAGDPDRGAVGAIQDLLADTVTSNCRTSDCRRMQLRIHDGCGGPTVPG